MRGEGSGAGITTGSETGAITADGNGSIRGFSGAGTTPTTAGLATGCGSLARGTITTGAGGTTGAAIGCGMAGGGGNMGATGCVLITGAGTTGAGTTGTGTAGADATGAGATGTGTTGAGAGLTG